MNKKIKLFSLILLISICIPLLSGCGIREKLTYKGKEGTITFNVLKDKYKLSTNEDDFRTSKEQAILIADDFKIGIEFNSDFEYFYNSDFNEVKKLGKEYKEYNEVTYSEVKGIQYFYSGYMRYDVLLPIKESKKHFLVLTVYGKKDDAKSAKKAIKSDEVRDVLEHMEFSAK